MTLVGPGGIGKTRLATELAIHTRQQFPDGVFFVSLVAITHVEDMLPAIIEATPFQYQANSRDPQEQFFAYLREKTKPLLLILDNFEHLLDGADILSEILAVTSGIKILVTSREALNLQEEWVRPLSGLSYPIYENGASLESYSAIQLFMDRARRIRGDFDMMQDSHSVVEICRLVEGMPLAIELAVGWLKTLQPTDILKEIQHNIDILSTRSRNLPERHRNIRYVFSHSWQLLSHKEQTVFQNLSVFRGGFTREAAEMVAGASLHILANLVDKSLVRSGANGRYDIHELLRQFGAERLEAAEQTAVIELAYIEYYLGMLHRLEGDIKAHHQMAALNTIQADFENIRNAWQQAAQQQHYPALNEAVESLHFFGDMRGRYHEVVSMLRAAVDSFPADLNPSTELMRNRIQARLIRLILLGNIRIDIDLRSQIDASLATARQQQDQAETAYLLLLSGIVAIWEHYGDYAWKNPAIGEIFREGYSLYQALNDPFYLGEALGWLASCVQHDGKTKNPGWAELQQSLEIRREIGDKNGIAWITLNMTEIMLSKLDYAGCEQYAREALALMREIGSLKGMLQSLNKVALMTLLRGAFSETLTLLEEMRELAEETNNLDGKMGALGLMAFLIGIMDENYEEAQVLARKSYALSLEPFFGGHNDLGARWGQPIADCGLKNYEAAREGYRALDFDTHDPAPATICLAIEAASLADAGELEEAAEYLGLAFQQQRSFSGWLHQWALVTRLRNTLAEAMGEVAYQAAWERGSRLAIEPTIQALLGSPPAIKDQTELLEPLSERELEVLALIGEGLSNREIAERLYLSVGTVKVHTRNIYGKLNVSSRTQALAQAAKLNLL